MSNALTLICRCAHPRGDHTLTGLGLPARCTARRQPPGRWVGDTEPCPCPEFHSRRKETIDDDQ